MGSFDPINFSAEQPTIQLSVAGTWRGGMFSNNTPASPPAYDPETQRVFFGSVDRHAIDVLDISNPYKPERTFQIDLSPFGGEPNGIDIHKGLLAVTVGGPDGSAEPSKVVFFNADGDLVADPIELPGAGRVAFTPDGQMLVVAIGGSPSDDYSVDPEGAVAIIDLPKASWESGKGHGHFDLPEVRIADFTAFNDHKDELTAAGVRIYGPNDPTVAQDVDPAGAPAITADSRYAWVSLQRNNALALVDLHKGEVTEIIPLGSKDHSLATSGFDASDKDDGINIVPWPVHSFYSPDGPAILDSGNETYIVTPNEGDPKDFSGYSEKVRVADLTLDPVAFPNAEEGLSLSFRHPLPAARGLDGPGMFA